MVKPSSRGGTTRLTTVVLACALATSFAALFVLPGLSTTTLPPPQPTTAPPSTPRPTAWIAPPRNESDTKRKTLNHPTTSTVGSRAPCGEQQDCLACLTCPSGGGCVWCASTASCLPHDAASAIAECSDVEDKVCPAILHSSVPQTMRVIHVAIRKGGPEALVQLHLALNHWGFATSLDTRKSKKQKGGHVVPFFTEMYAKEFARAPPLRWELNYDAWLESAAEGDVMIATETWACRNDWVKTKLPSGARQMQWHLTVWPKKPRTGCTIAAHTNHIAQEYMLAPRRSLMFPYISPHIVRLAESRRDVLRSSKKPIVMYDGDVLLKDEDLAPRPGGPQYSVRKATGFTPQDLYDMYTKTTAGIDLNLPGAERFIYEASLFDVCVIVDNIANGADKADLPLPDRFRVKPNDKGALLAAVDDCVRNYDTAIASQAPLKKHTLNQRTRFLRHVRRYFSSSVHVVTHFASQADVDMLCASFVLHTLLALPFASIELLLAPGVIIPPSVMSDLAANSYLAAVTITADIASPTLALGAWTSDARTAYVMYARPDVVIVSPDTVHGLGMVVKAVEVSAPSGAVALVKGAGYWFMASHAVKRLRGALSAQQCGGFFPCEFDAAAPAGLAAIVINVETTTEETANVKPSLLPEGAWVGIRHAIVHLGGGGALTTRNVGVPVGLSKALVDWGAQDVDGGSSTMGSLDYLCSHPLYRTTKGAAKCDWSAPA